MTKPSHMLLSSILLLSFLSVTVQGSDETPTTTTTSNNDNKPSSPLTPTLANMEGGERRQFFPPSPMILGGGGGGGGFFPSLFAGLDKLSHLGEESGEWIEHDTAEKITIVGELKEDQDPHRIFVEANGNEVLVKMQERSVTRQQHGDAPTVGKESNKNLEKTFVLPFEVTDDDLKKTYKEHSVTIEIEVPKGVKVEEGDQSPLASASSYSFSSNAAFADPPGFEKGDQGMRAHSLESQLQQINSAFAPPGFGPNNNMMFGGAGGAQQDFGNFAGAGFPSLLGTLFPGLGPIGTQFPRQLEEDEQQYRHDAVNDGLDRKATDQQRADAAGQQQQNAQGLEQQQQQQQHHMAQMMSPFSIFGGGFPHMMTNMHVGHFGGLPQHHFAAGHQQQHMPHLMMMQGSPFGGLESLLSGLGGAGGGGFGGGFGGHWHETTGKNEITFSRTLPPDVDPNDVSVSVHGKRINIRDEGKASEGAADQNNIMGSHTRNEQEMFFLPFNGEEADISKDVDEATHRVTLHVPAPKGVTLEEDSPPQPGANSNNNNEQDQSED